MKILNLFLVLISLPLCAQNMVDPGIDGRTLDQFHFLKDYTVMFDTAEGVERLRPRGVNGLVVTVNTKTGEQLNAITDEKGMNVFITGSDGTFLVKREGGAVINPFKKASNSYNVILPGGNDSNFVKIEDNTSYENDDFHHQLRNNTLVIVGPTDKSFRLNRKLKSDKAIDWVLRTYDLQNNTTEELGFTPKAMAGKQQVNGHVLLDVFDDSFMLMSKTFNADKVDKANKQDLYVSHYDFKGKLLKEVNLSFEIDRTRFDFVNAYLKSAVVRDYYGGKSYNQFTAAGTGTVYYDQEKDIYYICTVLKAASKKQNSKALVIKKDANNKTIWSKEVDIFGEKPSKYDLNDTYFEPVFSADKIMYRKIDYSSRNEGGVIIGTMSADSGELISETVLEKLKGITELDDTKGNWHMGRIIKDELSDNVVLGTDAVLAYGVNADVKAFLKAEQPDKNVYYFANLNRDGSISLLKADFNNKVYRLYFFEES